MTRTALVTGAAGFIGRHMFAALNTLGYHTTGIDVRDRYGVTRDDARDFFRHDRRHYDVVIHAAAVVGGRQVIDGDPLAQAVNLELDAAMFAWARSTRPGRVIYLSSSSVYPAWLQRSAHEYSLDFAIEISGTEHLIGKSPTSSVINWSPYPLREVDAKITDRWHDPDALYGWTKLTGEKLAVLARADGVNVSVVRPFSGYGEDQDDCYPFPAFAKRARNREDPFMIWGSGDQVRDWVHVDDICRVVMIMIEQGIDGPVNVGSGEPVTMEALARKMCAAAKYDPVICVQPSQPMGVMYRVADVTRMREFYTPAVSLSDGISRALKMGD